MVDKVLQAPWPIQLIAALMAFGALPTGGAWLVTETRQATLSTMAEDVRTLRTEVSGIKRQLVDIGDDRRRRWDQWAIERHRWAVRECAAYEDMCGKRRCSRAVIAAGAAVCETARGRP